MRTALRVIIQASLILWGAMGIFPAAAQEGVDPGDPGPHAVTRQEYDFGVAAFAAPGFPGPIELTGVVHSPTDLSGGPFPLVIFLHGRHATCFQGAMAFLQWPCQPGRLPIPSYQGYDYVGGILASHGYIVVSISANGINAVDNNVTDLGMLARAQLIERHLQLWEMFHTTGGPPFGDRFVGRVNLNNIGTMGHSRGGEGVMRHIAYSGNIGSPYVVQAVVPLAPVNFIRVAPNNVPLMVPLPYCDGDVADLQGVHFFDDVRYNLPGDTAAKHALMVMGGNHNFYNTIWTPGMFPAGTADDWTAFVPGGAGDPHCGLGPTNRRLTPAQQRGTGIAYFNAFFRTYLGGEDFNAILKGDAAPPPSAMTTELFLSYHPADDPAARLDVNRLLNAANLTTNTLGGAVTQTGITPYDLCGGLPPQPRHCLPTPPQSTARQPHTTPSARAGGRRGLSQLRAGWTGTSATYQNDLPEGARDVSTYFALQFRAGVNFADARNPAGMPRDFSVNLTDGGGNTATTLVSAWSGALFYPPGTVTVVPKLFLNTIRIPLSAFSGVDLTDIRSITFSFDQTASGALLISDILFADTAAAGTN